MVTETNPAKNGQDETALRHLANVSYVGGKAETSICPFSGK